MASLQDEVWTDDHFEEWLEQSWDILDDVLEEIAMEENLREAVTRFNHLNGHVQKELLQVNPDSGSVETPPIMDRIVDVTPTELHIPSNEFDHSIDRIRLFSQYWVTASHTHGGGNVQWQAIRRSWANNMRQFTGRDFSWRHEMNKLMWQSMPGEAGRVLVKYYPEYPVYGENKLQIADPYVKKWVKRMFSALCKLEEGNLTSKASAINIDVGGRDIRNQAEEEIDELENELEERAVYYPQGPRTV